MSQIEALQLSVMMSDGSLTPHEGSLRAFEDGVNTEVRFEAQNPSTAVLLLERERVRVEMQEGAIEVHCEFPQQDYMERFVSVANHAIKCVGSVERLERFVVAIQLLTDLDGTAFSHLAELLFSPDMPLPEDWRLRGGFGLIGVQDDEGRAWSITAEPRFRNLESSKLVIHMGMVTSLSEPDAHRMLPLVAEVWRTGHEQTARMSQ